MIVGLDLSLTATGVAHWNNGAVVATGTVSSVPQPCDEQRLISLKASIMDYLPSFTDLAVVESPSFQSKTGSHSLRDGLYWAVRTELFSRKIAILPVPPMSLKKFILGGVKKGDNTKELMIREVWRRYGVEARDNNQADAAGLAILGAAYLGHIEMQTAAQREVIEKLKAGPAPKKRKKVAA